MNDYTGGRPGRLRSYAKRHDEQHNGRHAGVPPRASRRPRRLRRAVAIAAALAGVALLAAACGGGSAPATATPAAQGGSNSASTADALPYTQCMRAHGVPNFPDPSPNAGGKPFTGQSLQQAGVDPSSPQAQAAGRACAHLYPAPNPAQFAQQTSEELRYATCMRAHGVLNYPDPSHSPTGAPVLPLTPGVADSPDFQPAQQACHSVDPGVPAFPANNSGKGGS
jgi:hypothetical protein